MTDPLSMASAVAGLVSLADVVLSKTYRYVTTVKSAEKSIKELLRLLESKYGTMNVLKTRLRVLDTLSTTSTSLYTRPGIMDDCARLLEDINQKLAHYDFGKNTSKMKQHLQKLRWPFEASQTNELVEQLGRFNQILVTALQADTLSAVYETFRAASEIRDDIKKLESSLSVKINNLINIELDKAQQEAFNHYNRCDPTSRHDIAKKLCQQGTGKWFTEGDVFTAWFEGTRSKLWLSGIPGAGKTILASSIIQRARLQAAQMIEPTALIYFYCDYKDSETHEVDNILSTLAAQLGRQSTRAMDALSQQYVKFHKAGRSPTLEEPPDPIDTIRSLCSHYQNVFVMVDGLDECGQNISKVTKALNKIAHLDSTKVRCILLSRVEIDIERALLPHFEEIKIAAQSHDLKLYIHSRFEDIDDDDPDFKSEILNALVDKADGMFRWVACQIDYLGDLPSVEERKKALHQLPPDLNSTYDRILERLNQKPSSTQELVHLTLSWLILGRSHDLNFTALREALAIRCGQTKLQHDKIPSEQIVLRHCSSFIRKSADGNHIEPAHFTVTEYLTQIPVSHQTLSQYRIDKNAGTLLLAKLCLTYLKFEDFEDIQSMRQAKQRVIHYKFRKHAVEHWADYARFQSTDETFLTMAVEFCKDVSSVTHLTWLYDYIWYDTLSYYEWEDSSNLLLDASSEESIDSENDNNEDKFLQNSIWKKMQGWVPIHCASLLRLPELVSHFSQNRVDMNAKSAGGTPGHLAMLGRAAFNDVYELPFDTGSTGVECQMLKNLFEAGADPASEWYYPDWQESKSILQLVLEADLSDGTQADCLSLLLDAGLLISRNLVESLEQSSRLQLYDICQNVVRLEHVQDDYKAEWLDSTRYYSHELDDLVPTSSVNADQLHLLHALLRSAAQADQVSVLTSLLSRPEVDIDDVDDHGQSALSVAAKSGSLHAIKVLLDRGANVDLCDIEGQTVFHHSTMSEVAGAAEMIYHSSARTNLKDSHGKSAWYYAAMWDNVAALKLLQSEYEGSERSYCAMLSEKDSILFAAASIKCDAAVLLLTRVTGAVAVCDQEGRNLIHYGANLKTDTIRKLIDQKLDCTQRDNQGRTALHSLCAERCDVTSVCEHIEILLQQNCKITDICCSGNTPLHLLFQNRDARINGQVLQLLCTDMVLRSVNSAGHNPFDSLLLHQWSSNTNFDLAFDYLMNFRAKPASKKSCYEWQRPLLTNNHNRARSFHIFTKLLKVLPQIDWPESHDVVQSIATWAALHGEPVLLKTALESGVDVLKRNHEISDLNILELVCSSMYDGDIIQRAFRGIENDHITRIESQTKPLLHLTCQASNSNHLAITELLKRNRDIDQRDPLSGSTPLMEAACRNKVQHVRTLLEAKADLEARNALGWTAVAYAVASSDIEIIQQFTCHYKDNQLCQGGYYLEIPETTNLAAFAVPGSSLLHLASLFGDVASFETVLEMCADKDPNQITEHHLTPLHIASTRIDAREVVEVLIMRDANVQARDIWGATPLHWAAERDCLLVVRTLHEAGADINAIDKSGRTPLHEAARRGNYSTVQYLLKEGAVSTRDNRGLNPELLARTKGYGDLADLISQHFTEHSGPASVAIQSGSELKRLQQYNSVLKVIASEDERLLRKMIAIVDQEDDPPCSGCTPVSVALRKGNSKLVKAILDLNYPLRSYPCSCQETETAFYDMQEAAARPQLSEVFGQLFRNLHADDQLRPLVSSQHSAIVAASHGNSSYLGEFLDHLNRSSSEVHSLLLSIRMESPVNSTVSASFPIEYWDMPDQVNNGAGLSHVAAALNQLDCVRTLSACSTLINATDSTFSTPLHFAAANDAIETIGLLLDAGADIEARTSLGSTPLILAASYGRSAAVRRLLQRGAQTYFSNIQPLRNMVMSENTDCRAALLATKLRPFNFDTSSIFMAELSSICFESQIMTALFKARPGLLGHCILLNGIYLLKHLLKWLELHEMLKQQLDYQKPSALCLAAQYGDPRIAESLLKYGSDIDCVGCEEGSPLIVACKTNRLEMVKFLVRRGAKTSYKDDNGKEISCIEAAGKYHHIVQWLLVGRHNDQHRLEDTLRDSGLTGESKDLVQDIKPWSGTHRMQSPLPPEFKQARGDTLLKWHIRKRYDLRAYEGKVLRSGEGIKYPFINYN